jgi:hypothetical protein
MRGFGTGQHGDLYWGPLEWNLHYESWIIEDGEPHLRVGETFKWFATTFWADSKLTKVVGETKTALPVGDFRYQVLAEVVYVSEKACVIDFGLNTTATADLLPPDCKEGDYVSGEITLGLPVCTEVLPQDLFKVLARSWQVKGISADVTPYVALPDSPRVFIRDESQVRYEEVPATITVKAHTYILRCCEVPSSH